MSLYFVPPAYLDDMLRVLWASVLLITGSTTATFVFGTYALRHLLQRHLETVSDKEGYLPRIQKLTSQLKIMIPVGLFFIILPSILIIEQTARNVYYHVLPVTMMIVMVSSSRIILSSPLPSKNQGLKRVSGLPSSVTSHRKTFMSAKPL